jgi:hypothetical protein
MGFWNTLGEAAATFGGDEPTAERFARQREHKQALSEQELQAQTNQILGDVTALNERRAKLDTNSPTYQQDLKTIDQALHDARQVFTDLYHPAKNPGAFSKLHGFIQSHLGKNKGRQAAAPTPAAAKQSMSDRISAVDTAAYAPTAEKNKFSTLRRQLKEAMPNASEADLDRAVMVNAGAEAKPKATNPSWKMYISPDGKQRDYYDVNDKDSIPQGWMPVSKGAESTPKVGSFGDFMIQAYGPHPTAENYEEGKKLWAQSSAGTTVGEHLIMVPQKDGSIVPITVQTTTTKSFNGAPSSQGQPAPATPKTPAEARSRITPPHAGVVAQGKPVGGRLTGPQTAAQKKYDEATGLVKVADLVAAQPHDAINQKRLAVQLERLSAGRFTTQALQYVIKAGWGNTMEQWANNVSTGELPEDIVRQLVDGAHQYQAGALEELKASGATPPAGAVDQDVDEIIRILRQQKQATPPPQ